MNAGEVRRDGAAPLVSRAAMEPCRDGAARALEPAAPSRARRRLVAGASSRAVPRDVRDQKKTRAAIREQDLGSGGPSSPRQVVGA